MDLQRHDVVFPGWDSGDPGTPVQRSLWMYGIEPGGSDTIQQALNEELSVPENGEVANYSVKCQWDVWKWPFNRKAHMLISVVEGMPVHIPTFAQDARQYAEAHKIFERDCKGYFKGNLFPQMNPNMGVWSDAARIRTGFESREEFYKFFRHYFTNLHGIVLKHRPRLFIGVGIGQAQEFAKVVCGEPVDFETQTFAVNGHNKRILLKSGDIPLAVVPHLTGGSNGLNSTEAIITAGKIIRSALLKG